MSFLKMRSVFLAIVASSLMLTVIGCSKPPKEDKVPEAEAKQDVDQGKSAMPGGGPPGQGKP